MHMLQLQQLSIFFVLPHCLRSVSLGVNVFLMTSLRIAFLFLLFRMREGSQHFTDLKKFPFSGLAQIKLVFSINCSSDGQSVLIF